MLPLNLEAKNSKAPNINNWSTLPILHEGRVKPIDSFARIFMKKFSNSERTNGLNASEWVALSIFDPATAIDLPIFKIRDSGQFGLEKRKENLYSYTELSEIIQSQQQNILTLLEQNQNKWSDDQAALMRHYEHYILYTQLLRSLTIILPLGLEENSKNFLDYKKNQRALDKKTKQIVQQKGIDLEKYTAEEREISFLSYQLKMLENGAENNVLFRIIPENWNSKETNWQSPWGIINKGKGSPKGAEYIALWKNMAIAYQNYNAGQWQDSVSNAHALFNNPRLKIEKIYNLLHLLKITITLYAISLLLVIISNFVQSKKIIKKIELTSLFSITIGIIAHTIYVALRVYILERPPVGTLYESILFVSLICVAGFTFSAWHQKKNNIGILLGSLSGVLLLTTAQGFVSEDTMSTLVAVLNTNFWLGTHVLCITIGYATCFIASLMAHYQLTLRWIRPDNTAALTQNFKNLKIIILLSLLLTTIGTILGGIWADQSWGRFWGWDPKENGALLIVLWLAWLLHGRISKHISDLGFVIGSAFLSIIVVLAWFGVNLLNVGLHSYGFITNVALGIGSFCILEIILISILWQLGQKQRRTV
jgi:ABC-type transport system involved in cytochrome c biogenesis permease subunit